jgi:hypothetical protein
MTKAQRALKRIEKAQRAQRAYMATQFACALPQTLVVRVTNVLKSERSKTAAIKTALEQWLSVAEEVEAEVKFLDEVSV